MRGKCLTLSREIWWRLSRRGEWNRVSFSYFLCIILGGCCGLNLGCLIYARQVLFHLSYLILFYLSYFIFWHFKKVLAGELLRVKTLAMKPDNVISVTRAHMVEEENWYLQVVLWLAYAQCGTCTHTHTHSESKQNNFTKLKSQWTCNKGMKLS